MWNVIINPVTRYSSFIILLSLLLSACEINQKEVLPEDGFLKIYNHPDEDLSFYPESVIELNAGGYIFVSAIKDETSDIEYPYTNLVRTGASGEVEWNLDYDWLAPSSRLIYQDGQLGFVAMDPHLNAYVIQVDVASGEITGQHDLEMTMPLAVNTDAQGNLIVLGYDFVSRSSWISKYSSTYVLQRSNKLSVNTDLELPIQRHLNKTGQDYPFFIGEYSTDNGTGYYISCFYNYTLRTVFLDISSLEVTGDIYSFQTDEAVSSVIHKRGSVFGLTGYYEGNNYIIPETGLNVLTSQSIKDIPGEQLYELTNRARVITGSLITDQEDYALFISQTNSNALVIYQYSMETDSLVNTHYRLFDERIEVTDVIQTADKGLAILSGIHILGKYQRPVLVKIPEDTFLPEEEK